jgi:hypothetical protein
MFEGYLYRRQQLQMHACLTVSSPLVTSCTTRFNIKKSSIFPHRVHLCVLYESQKQNSDYFSTDRFFYNGDGVFTARYELNLQI